VDVVSDDSPREPRRLNSALPRGNVATAFQRVGSWVRWGILKVLDGALPAMGGVIGKTIAGALGALVLRWLFGE
jgi:hypothetical protein